MKKLILTLFILIGFNVVKAETNPPITIEFKYKNTSDTSVYFNKLKSDNDFCCNFVVTATPSTDSTQSFTLLKHTKTGVILGTFYGTPSKEFIMDVYRGLYC